MRHKLQISKIVFNVVDAKNGAGIACRVLLGRYGGSRCEDGLWRSVVGCGLWVV